MHRRPLVGAAIAIAAVAFVVTAALTAAVDAPAGAADGRSESAADAAVAWLAAQQQPDGGFEVAGFAGFETPDAVLAIGEAAQSDLTWSAAEALAAVDAIRRDGNSALHYLDDLVDEGVDAGKAAQLIVVAVALGLDPASFDPAGDTADDPDLVAMVDAARQADGSYGPEGVFNRTLEAMRALRVLGRPVGADTVAWVKDRQTDSGGWAFNGDSSGDTEPDVDTTARAIRALGAAGLNATDPSVADGLAWLGGHVTGDGAWTSFGSADPNATAMAVLAVAAAGYDPRTPCWRDAVAPGLAEEPYSSPDAWMRSQQTSEGRIASPNDSFGVNTFATTQTVQALLRNWQPVAAGARQPCPATGYVVAGRDGGWRRFGGNATQGAVPARNGAVVAAAGMPAGDGQYLFASDGGVFAVGSARFHGSAGALRLNRPVVAAAATPTGGGYWLFAGDGGVFSYGDAPFLGSLGDRVLNQPIVAAAATPTGEGYWLFAADGGVFAFGDARFLGSLGDRALARPIVAGAPRFDGNGYWMFAADGGVFAFGAATYQGSLPALGVMATIVGGAATPGTGYWLLGRDGGVFAFGDAPFLGAGSGVAPAAAITR